MSAASASEGSGSGSGSPPALVPAVTGLLHQLATDFDLTDVLDRSLHAATRVVGADGAGVIVRDAAGQLRLLAATPAASAVLEIFQLNEGEGPCLEAMRSMSQVQADRLASAGDRWPGWAPAAVELGFSSITALPLVSGDDSFGALNVLWHGDVVPDVEQMEALWLFAALAGVATFHQQQHAQSRTLVEQLTGALESRIVIEQAKGILAARAGTDPEQAFAALRRFARSHHLKIRDVATDIVEGRLSDLASVPPR